VILVAYLNFFYFSFWLQVGVRHLFYFYSINNV